MSDAADVLDRSLVSPALPLPVVVCLILNLEFYLLSEPKIFLQITVELALARTVSPQLAMPPLFVIQMRMISAATMSQLLQPQLGLPPKDVVVKSQRNRNVRAENMLARCLIIVVSLTPKTNGSQCSQMSRTAD